MRRPEGVPITTPNLIASPWVGTLVAMGWTGLLALGGRLRPGTFVKSAAIFSVLNFSWEAAGLYGRRELHRGIFKMLNIEPQPGELWERTKYWTVEDTTLYGGALGIAAVLNRRAVPGAHGFFRYFGAAMVGCDLGYAVGTGLFERTLDTHYIGEHNWLRGWIRPSYYQHLKTNPQSQASLSRIGKFALEYHTPPHLRTSMSALAETAKQRLEILHPPISVSFVRDELDGPDIKTDSQECMDSIPSRDGNSIQERLGRIQDLRSPPPNGPFDIDVKALKKEFLKLQSTAHPDLHQQADKKRAEAHSAQINEAYKTLENPLLRAQYLLSMRGEELEDETAKVDDMQLLLEVMETREMLEEAEWDGNLKEIWDKNENRIKKNVKAIDRAFKRDDLEAAKKAAVSLRYWVNIRDTILEKD
ncbi:co-chaperone protein HscB mitochondrial precursor [Pyrenophora tritici-repentis]|nr:co-chaperone protein HscB mitochondrial precursor [Pyrenophora tritici-repentis]KAI0579095.1 co-chaperone protein HscB mitochondrial precursor [Pyrenophora tritici-repentis]PZC94028.1 DjlA, DnaJ-domain-containing protein 1 [Pyrenophora tritici-repentis]PZD28394.1 DjlA, DnaJ-domain-containing protein 1 [Pyrenophora tritici-repentis]